MKWPLRLSLLSALLGIAPVLRAELVINEIFYNAPDDLDLEFVELYHSGKEALDVSGWTLADKKDTLFKFPQGTILKSDAYVVLCREPTLFEEFYGSQAQGELAHGLGNGGDELTLKDANEKVIEALTYDDEAPWPIAADGYSASLERVHPSAPSKLPTSWEPSPSSTSYQSRPGGTPGEPNACQQSGNPPILSEVIFSKKRVNPGEAVPVTATLPTDADPAYAKVKEVELRYRFATAVGFSEASTVAMQLENGVYRGTLPAQDATGILRFQVVATGEDGSVRTLPAPFALRPAFSVFVSPPIATDAIPAAHLILPTQALRTGQQYTRRRTTQGNLTAQGPSAIAITDPESKETTLFDFIHIALRNGGYKVRLHKDRLWKEISTLNVLTVFNPRHSLCESLAFELHRRAGNPASWADYFRVTIDGQPLGYHLAFEQPNKSFLRRHKLDDDGNLYKAIWQGSHNPSPRAYQGDYQGRGDIIGRHEKKTNIHEDYDDLIDLVKRLEIGHALESPEHIINYFAVNSLLSHWDGFHNNYFIYHEKSKKKDVWRMFPWDQDKTWGFHDSIRGTQVFSDLPLRAGSQSFVPEGNEGPASKHRGRIGLPGATWWRYGGEVSRAVLEHPETNLLFLKRLRELAMTVFTEEAFGPAIDRLEKHLLPEVRDDENATRSLKSTLQVYREHLKERRRFVLEQEEIRSLP